MTVAVSVTHEESCEQIKEMAVVIHVKNTVCILFPLKRVRTEHIDYEVLIF